MSWLSNYKYRRKIIIDSSNVYLDNKTEVLDSAY